MMQIFLKKRSENKKQLKVGDKVYIRKDARRIMGKIDSKCAIMYKREHVDMIGFITHDGEDVFGKFYRVDNSLGWYEECLEKIDERLEMLDLEKVL